MSNQIQASNFHTTFDKGTNSIKNNWREPIPKCFKRTRVSSCPVCILFLLCYESKCRCKNSTKDVIKRIKSRHKWTQYVTRMNVERECGILTGYQQRNNVCDDDLVPENMKIMFKLVFFIVQTIRRQSQSLNFVNILFKVFEKQRNDQNSQYLSSAFTHTISCCRFRPMPSDELSKFLWKVVLVFHSRSNYTEKCKTNTVVIQLKWSSQGICFYIMSSAFWTGSQ